jgi:hypothetical protein
VKTDNPRENFLDKPCLQYFQGWKKKNIPMIFMWLHGNVGQLLQDADLPEAVRSWNEDYAFPKLIISGGHQIMRHMKRCTEVYFLL